MARPHPALLALARGDPLPPVRDLEALVHSAVEHRMTGLLWSRLQEDEGLDDEEWRGRLAQEDVLNWARHQMLWDGLGKLVARLADHGAQVATFKGVTAEARWYDRCGERPCYDLDILLDPADLPRAGRLLRALRPDHPLADHFQALAEVGYLQSVPVLFEGIPVDLHIDAFKLGIETRQADLVWERTRPWVLPDGGTVRVLDAETSLVHFLLHHSRDRFRYLLGHVDVARVLEREEIDWDFADRFLRTEGLEEPIYVALGAIHQALGRPPPRRAGSVTWRTRLWRHLWRPSVRLRGEAGRFRFGRRGTWGLPFTARGRLGEAVAWWARRLLPPAPLLDYRHPGLGGPYPWRLLAGRYRTRRERRREARHHH